MILLGLDIGTSSIKASAVDAQTRQTLATVQYPDKEVAIDAPEKGWAEQSPDQWWHHAAEAIKRLVALGVFSGEDVASIGISYQMHGLVMVDQEGHVIRPAIIWCDSRAASIGEEAFLAMGPTASLTTLLNSPGNFTASKLAWVKKHQPELFDQIHHIMLPGDFIGLRLTGQATTTPAALSEGIFWDFQKGQVSDMLMNHFGFSKDIIPPIQPVFSDHGRVLPHIAAELGIAANIPVSYKAGDQPNNALSLNVLEPGEIAATAGTSGVIYAVSDQIAFDPASRINTFAHVNHQEQTRIGILLCINGTGILNRWVRDQWAPNESYATINQRAADIPAGSDGVLVLPFGNGIERVLENRLTGVQFSGLDLNRHTSDHVFRAVQEGIACSFRYGFDIMKSQGVAPKVIRAGKANLFLSDVFTTSLVNLTQTPVELYDTDGSKGAALAGGFGAGHYSSLPEAMSGLTHLRTIEPTGTLEDTYQAWAKVLKKALSVE